MPGQAKHLAEISDKRKIVVPRAAKGKRTASEGGETSRERGRMWASKRAGNFNPVGEWWGAGKTCKARKHAVWGHSLKWGDGRGWTRLWTAPTTLHGAERASVSHGVGTGVTKKKKRQNPRLWRRDRLSKRV